MSKVNVSKSDIVSRQLDNELNGIINNVAKRRGVLNSLTNRWTSGDDRKRNENLLRSIDDDIRSRQMRVNNLLAQVPTNMIDLNKVNKVISNTNAEMAEQNNMFNKRSESFLDKARSMATVVKMDIPATTLTPSEKHLSVTNKSSLIDYAKKQNDMSKVKFMSFFEPDRADSIYTGIPYRVAPPTEESEIARKSLAFKTLFE